MSVILLRVQYLSLYVWADVWHTPPPPPISCASPADSSCTSPVRRGTTLSECASRSNWPTGSTWTSACRTLQELLTVGSETLPKLISLHVNDDVKLTSCFTWRRLLYYTKLYYTNSVQCFWTFACIFIHLKPKLLIMLLLFLTAANYSITVLSCCLMEKMCRKS